MAKEEKKKEQVDYIGAAKNWEDRVNGETQSVHKWKETWGELFKGEVPFDYEEKIKYLEKQLKDSGDFSMAQPPKVQFMNMFIYQTCL